MKNQLKIAAASLIISVSATAAFADLSEAVNADIGIITSISSLQNLVDSQVQTDPGANLGLVVQTGEGNIAYIEQSVGLGNIAAIIQTSAIPGSMGYVIQSGSSNRALILQK